MVIRSISSIVFLLVLACNTIACHKEKEPEKKISCRALVHEWVTEIQDLKNPSDNVPKDKVTINFDDYKTTILSNCPDPSNRSVTWQKYFMKWDPNCEIHTRNHTSCLCMTKLKNEKDPMSKMFIYCEPK